MTDDVLRELIEFLKDASPLVWNALIKQVYVEASGNLAWAIVLLIAAIVLYKLGKLSKQKSKGDEEHYPSPEWAIICGLFWVSSASAAMFSFGLLVSAVQRFINPEFYAIRFILWNIGGG